jgi:hypothetical protein
LRHEFGSKRERIREENCNEKLHDLYCIPEGWMRWAVHVARVGVNRNILRGFDMETRKKETICTYI